MTTARSLTRRGALLAGGGLLAAAPAVAAPGPRPALGAPWTREGFVERAGGRVHWVEAAPSGPVTGVPLILLHKLGGWVADWRKIAPLLARGRRVIAIDLPGHGESIMLGPPPYIHTVPETAALLVATLDELGLDRVTLIGNSLGGVAAVVLSACWPERVARLALVSVSLNAARPRADLAQMDAEVRSQFGPNWEPLPRSGESLQRFGSLDPAVATENNESRAKAGVWVRSSERGVAVTAVDAYLPRIAAPTLLVYADRGIYTQWEAVGRAKLRSVVIERIADSGSFVHQEKPVETAAAIHRFLAVAP